MAIFQRIRSNPITGMMDEINRASREGMTVIIDSSGFKITERGDWLSSKWNRKRKGWIKMHIAIDTDKMNVFSLTITDQNTHLTSRSSERCSIPFLARSLRCMEMELTTAGGISSTSATGEFKL